MSTGSVACVADGAGAGTGMSHPGSARNRLCCHLPLHPAVAPVWRGGLWVPWAADGARGCPGVPEHPDLRLKWHWETCRGSALVSSLHPSASVSGGSCSMVFSSISPCRAGCKCPLIPWGVSCRRKSKRVGKHPFDILVLSLLWQQLCSTELMAVPSSG